MFKTKINILQVWDTAGQERFRAMAPMYYRNANAALLVFDITQEHSFDAVRMWVKGNSKTTFLVFYYIMVYTVKY